MPLELPNIQQDGSFCVVAKFTTKQNASNLQEQIATWCNQWVIEHEHWQRPTEESSVGIDKGPWDYREIFTGPPYVSKAEGNQLWLRLDVRVYSYWWRDWFAPMMGNLVSAFPELVPDNKLSFNCGDSADQG